MFVAPSVVELPPLVVDEPVGEVAELVGAESVEVAEEVSVELPESDEPLDEVEDGIGGVDVRVTPTDLQRP